MSQKAATALKLPDSDSQFSQNSQFLTFFLANETYGVEILRVREIKGWSSVTKIPGTPSYIEGVINLRGTIVPIINLRMRFELEEKHNDKFTVVIVILVDDGLHKRTIGLVVDGVSDVVNINGQNVKPTPDFGTVINTDFIAGLVAPDEKTVMLLDVDRMLTSDELTQLEMIK